MANTNHKDLTGVSLHEPKDIAAATAGHVYIADGAASGAMAVNPPQISIYQYQESAGVNASSNHTTSWTKIPIATELSDVDSISSISSSVISLVAGTWYIKAWASFKTAASNESIVRLRIQNTSAGTTVALGLHTTFNTTTSVKSDALQTLVSGVTRITATKNIEVQSIANKTVSFGLHDSLNAGVEVYAHVECWKIK